MKKKIEILIEKNFTLIFTIFLFLQPFLDVATLFSVHYFHKSLSVGMIVRFGFCLFFLLAAFVKKKTPERKYLYFIFLYLFFFLGFMFYQKGMGAIFYEGKVLLRTFYFPILLLSLWPYKTEVKSVCTDFKFVLLYSIYLFFIFVPNLLGLGFPSYVDSKEGMIGWFSSANEIGAILSILMPFLFSYFLSHKKYLLGTLYLGSTLFILLEIGTKVPILSFCLIVFLLVLVFFLHLMKQRKRFLLFGCFCFVILAGTLFMNLVPKTSFYKNLKIHMDFLGMNSVSEVFTNFHYLDHFVFSERLTLLSNTREIYQNASLSEKVFGLGYIKNYATDQVSVKMVEMDYYDIFYAHGILGTLVYFLPFLGIFITQRKKRNCLNVSNSAFLSCCLSLVLAFFSGHIFLSPAVSFYVVLVFLLLSKKKRKCKLDIV